MVVDRAKHYWQSVSTYRRFGEERKPIMLAGFLMTAVMQEKDPRLRQRLTLMIEAERHRLGVKDQPSIS